MKRYYHLLMIFSIITIAFILNRCGSTVEDYRDISLEFVEGPSDGKLNIEPSGDKVEVSPLEEGKTGISRTGFLILRAKTDASCSATVKVMTNNYSESAWVWQSSNRDIAVPQSARTEKDDEGHGTNTINGVKGGIATISVTGVDSEKSISFTVTVSDECGGDWDTSYSWIEIEKSKPEGIARPKGIARIDPSYADDIRCVDLPGRCVKVIGMGVDDGVVTVSATGNKSGEMGSFEVGVGCILTVKANNHSGTVNIGEAYGKNYNTIPPEGIVYKAIAVECGGDTPYTWTWKREEDYKGDITLEEITSTTDTATIIVNATNNSTETRFTITATREDNKKTGVGYLNVARLLVDKEWLEKSIKEHINDPNFIIVYAHGKTSEDNIIDGAIPYNIFNLNENFFIKNEGGLETEVGSLGISRDSIVVAYDASTGIFGRGDLGTYLLWVLDMLGHDIIKLHLLNGQFRQWIADGGVAGKRGTPTPITYDPNNEQIFNESLNTTASLIEAHLYESNYVWIATIGNYSTTPDYPNGEFTDHHIPCAKQIDFEDNFITPGEGETGDWRLKDSNDLLAMYESKDVTKDKTIATY